MFFERHHLNHGANLDLTLKPPSHGEGSGLVAVLGGGRGCVLRVTGQAAAVWVPLRGRLQIEAANGDSVALPGEMRVTEPESRIHAIGRGNAIWMAVLGTTSAWRRALGGHRRDADARTRAASGAPSRRSTKSGIARSHSRARTTANRNDKALRLSSKALPRCRSQFAPAIGRCPGRTFAQRRQVFVRLQRVRNYLAANCHLDIDNETLARMASYSPWHFIRAFRPRTRKRRTRFSCACGSSARAGCLSHESARYRGDRIGQRLREPLRILAIVPRAIRRDRRRGAAR